MPFEKVRVMGVKGWKGEIDGDFIDSGKVFVEEQLDSSRNTADQFGEGVASVAYALGSVEAARPLLGIGLEKGPILAELDFRRVTDGRGKSKTVVAGVRLLPAGK